MASSFITAKTNLHCIMGNNVAHCRLLYIAWFDKCCRSKLGRINVGRLKVK